MIPLPALETFLGELMSLKSVYHLSQPPSYNFELEPDAHGVVETLDNWWTQNGKIVRSECKMVSDGIRARAQELNTFLENGRTLMVFSKTLSMAKRYVIEQRDFGDTSEDERKLQDLINTVSEYKGIYCSKMAWSESAPATRPSASETRSDSKYDEKDDGDIADISEEVF